MGAPKYLQIKSKLYHNPKLEVCSSVTHRWGVFAKQEIKCHEILEEAPYFVVPTEEVEAAPSCEVYSYWLEDGYSLIGMGYAGLYNHSFKPNATYHVDKVNEIITHYATKDIEAGQEVVIDYGVDNAAVFGCYPDEDQTEIE